MPPRVSSSTGPVSNGTSSSRKHVTRSCTSCRRRKVKCSGEQPCSSCVLYQEECSYDAKHDGRKTASKAYVAALEQRVKELEALLATAGNAKVGTAARGDDDDVKTTAPVEAQHLNQASAASPVDSAELSAGVEQLRIDDATGEYRLYGHASTFMHLPTPHATLTRGSSSSASLPLKSFPPGFTLSGKSVPSNTFLCPSHPPPHPSVLSPTSLAAKVDFLEREHDITTFEIDWNLNLPPDVPSFDRQLHDELIELFLNYGNTWLRFVNAQLFLQDLRTCLSRTSQQRPTRTSYYSPLLHNSLLAVASGFSPRPIDTELFATKAKSLIEEENEVPLLSSVQGLFLLAEHYAADAKPKKGWLFYGIGNYSASNLGLAVSLHPLAEKGLIAAQVKDEREATFATWLLLDKLWSALLGRQPILFRRTYETALPCVDPAVDVRRWFPDVRDKTTSMPSYGATTHRYAAALVDVLERILETFYAFRASLYSVKVIEQVSAFHLELEKWHSSLPEPISISPYTHKQSPNHVITLHALFWFVVILLHRPYFSRPEGKPMLDVNKTAVQHCERAASKIVNLIEMHRRLPYGLRYSTVTLTQISFLSGTVHILSAINASSQNAPKKFDTAVALARACVGHLDEMGQSWKCATSSADILRRLIVEWCVKQSDGGVEVPTTSYGGGVKRRRLTGDNDDEPRDLYRKFWDRERDENGGDGKRGGQGVVEMTDLPATFAEDAHIDMTAAGLKPISLYDSAFFSTASSLPVDSATVTATAGHAPQSVPSFTRYQPPAATLPPQFDSLFATASTPRGSSTSTSSSHPSNISFMFNDVPTMTTTTADVDPLLLTDRVDPFATENVFAVFQGQDQWSQLGNMTMWTGSSFNDLPVTDVTSVDFGADVANTAVETIPGGDDSWLSDFGIGATLK
ncbi:hypothetical protein ACM66B_004876 [Microbotryomycetes sp. NB124-2]